MYMDVLRCFKKLSVVAAVCAVSLVGHAEREKIKISLATKAEIMSEVKDFLSAWRKSDPRVDKFYASSISAFLDDYDTLSRILTKDFLEYLTFGSDRYRDFSKFEKDKFWGYTPRWKFVRDFLFYAFNGFCPPTWKRACYALEIFNHSAAKTDITGRGFLFDRKLDLAQISGLEGFCDRVVKFLWSDVKRWFEETSSNALAPCRKLAACMMNMYGKVPENLINSISDESRKKNVLKADLRFDQLPMFSISEAYMLSPEFDKREEDELLNKKFKSDLEFGRKILDEIKSFRVKRLHRLYKIETEPGEQERCERGTPSFKADCATLFRFFTEQTVTDFFEALKKKKSSQERINFIKQFCNKRHFCKYLVFETERTFGLSGKQYFRENADKESGGHFELKTRYGWKLYFVDFLVREITLFGQARSKGGVSKNGDVYCISCDNAFGYDGHNLLSSISDLLYPRWENTLKKLLVSEKEKETAKKRGKEKEDKKER